MKTFQCAQCDRILPLATNGPTGCCVTSAGNTVCYTCQAYIDKAFMETHGRIMLYLVESDLVPLVQNSVGTLVFTPYNVRRVAHNLCKTQTFVHFNGPDGKVWFGRNVGDNMILHCRRTKKDGAVAGKIVPHNYPLVN